MCQQNDEHQALYALRQAAWDRFNARRSYEWKMCFSIWTGVLALTGFCATSESVLLNVAHAVILAVLVLGVHTFWQVNIARVNGWDLEQVYSLEDEIRNIASKPLTHEFRQRQKHWRWAKYWSHLSFVVITAVLLLILLVVICSRASDAHRTLIVLEGIMQALCVAVCIGTGCLIATALYWCHGRRWYLQGWVARHEHRVPPASYGDLQAKEWPSVSFQIPAPQSAAHDDENKN